MKTIFKDDDGNISSGRILSFCLFFIVTSVWVIAKIAGKEISNNDMTLIQWGWITAIGGKAIQKFAEVKK